MQPDVMMFDIHTGVAKRPHIILLPPEYVSRRKQVVQLIVQVVTAEHTHCHSVCPEILKKYHELHTDKLVRAGVQVVIFFRPAALIPNQERKRVRCGMGEVR